MSVRTLLKVAEKYAVDNAPTIVSAFAVTGTLSTAFLTGKATFKAAEIIAEHQETEDFQELGHQLTKKEKTKLVWPVYIPPAAAVVITVGCIVTANQISASRLAGMAAAYKLSEGHFEEYRDKIKEKMGIKDEQEARHEINQASADRSPIDYENAGTQLGRTNTPNGQVLFREQFTGRYFWSTMATVKEAENTINYRMLKDQYASLSDFYDLIGLANTSFSDQIGWSVENPCELYMDTIMADDTPCATMEYHNRPIQLNHYNRFH